MLSSIFSKEQKTSIVDAIKSAELKTSAEIRVHIESNCKANALERAVEVFSMLKMHKTEARNGVLVYVAVKDRKSAIIGDVNINKFVEKEFWNNSYAAMSKEFVKGNFTVGICSAINSLETELEAHFPYKSDDVNELPDDISFGK